MKYQPLLQQYPIISDQIKAPALGVVLRELEKVLLAGVPGDITEFGCYKGTSTLFMRRLLDAFGESESRRLFAYDSFEGLPPKAAQDASGAGEQFKAGELTVSRKQLLQEFHKANLATPIAVKGWFNEITEQQLPGQIAYAFLDGDFYDSIIDSLRLVWPRLSNGGIITVDDYMRDALPGVERAVRDFFQQKSVNIHHEHNIAIVMRK